MNLVQWEQEVLLNLAGKISTLEHWGASLGATLEFLSKKGLVQRTFGKNGVRYELTQAGIDLAEKLTKESKDDGKLPADRAADGQAQEEVHKEGDEAATSAQAETGTAAGAS